jgi:hypothetical protein
MARRVLSSISDSDSWHRVLSDDRQSGPKLASFFSRCTLYWASDPSSRLETVGSAQCALSSNLSGTCAASPRHHRRPRHHVKTSPCGPNANPNPSPNPNQARPVGLPPDALEAAAAQLERGEAVVAEARRSEAVRRVALALALALAPHSRPPPVPTIPARPNRSLKRIGCKKTLRGNAAGTGLSQSQHP